jgi:hypothetical protein
MSFSLYGIRISIALVVLCGVFFFYNKNPQFIVPLYRLKQRSRLLYTSLLSVVILCVVLLPLRLSFVSDTHVVTEKNLPVQILLDVSLSMAAVDLEPSRFFSAKNSLISLVKQLDGYHISLITFS